jgi:hypothetical protein
MNTKGSVAAVLGAAAEVSEFTPRVAETMREVAERVRL